MGAGRAVIGLAVAAAVAAAAGCGDDGPAPAAEATSPGHGPVEVTVSDTGYSMPSTVTGGVVAMRFHNTGAQPHEFALGRAAGRTPAQVRAALAGQSASGGGPPSWLADAAGVPLLTPGAEITLTRVLRPGTYVFLDGVPDARGVRGWDRGIVTVFAVAGDSGDPLPAPDAVITATRTRFVMPAIRPGTRTIELRNASGAGRGFLVASLNPGRTAADADRWGATIDSTGKLPAGPVPMTVLGAIQTIPSGASVFLTAGFAAGRTYRVSDDESGSAGELVPR